MINRILLCLASLIIISAVPFASGKVPDRRVVVVVFDGMRPDFVSAETTPNLWKMAEQGVFFANHHPVFCSATEVNGTAIATGTYPAHSTVIANKEYRPVIDENKPINIEKPEAIGRGDETSGGHYLAVSTVAERLHKRGIRTAIAGSKQVALLHDRAIDKDRVGDSQIIFEGAIRPSSQTASLIEALGPFPAAGKDKMARDNWTTQALLKVLWKEEVPTYSLLWLAEPDASQHSTGPGTALSLAAIKNSDANLGLLLGELERRGLRETTDVLVVSDHGFSTIERYVDTANELARAGFNSQRSVEKGLKSNDVLVVGNGGSVLLYVGDHDKALCQRLCDFLQKQDWVGVVFSREPIEGTFPLSVGHINSPEAPDLLFSLRGKNSPNPHGTPGLLICDGIDPGTGQRGTHASLNRTDMHNTLIAAGPDFRNGISDPLPTGNTDLAPTVLWLLNLKEEGATMDGRVLFEALNGDVPHIKSFDIRKLRSSRTLSSGLWEQYLIRSEVNGVEYIDEGNGSLH